VCGESCADSYKTKTRHAAQVSLAGDSSGGRAP